MLIFSKIIMVKVQICIFLCVLSFHQSWSFYEDEKQFAKDLSEMMEALKQSGTYDETGNLNFDLHKSHGAGDFTLLTKFKIIRDATVARADPHRVILRLKLDDEAFEFMDKFRQPLYAITAKFNQLLQYIQTPKSMPSNWHDFSANSQYFLLRDIFKIRIALVGRLRNVNSKTGLLHSLLARLRESCVPLDLQIRKLLIDTVQVAIKAEIKAIALVQFTSWIMSSITELFSESYGAHRFIHDPFADYVSIVQEALKLAPDSLRTCDPPSWIQDESAFEMDKLVQQVIFFPRKEDKKCKGRDNEINQHKSEITYFSHEETCYGRFFDCDILNLYAGCLSGSDTKRYEWITGTVRATQILAESCPSKRRIFAERGKLYCDCQCHENNNVISTAWIRSDIRNNMCITGLRFKRKNRLFFLQIKEGKLLRNGTIVPGSHRWTASPEQGDLVALSLSNKHFFLEDIMVPSGSIVTGVRFAETRRDGKEGFGIEVEGVQFDYKTGTLSEKVETGISSSTYNEKWTETNYGLQNSIYNTDGTHVPDSKSNEYVTLYCSSATHDFGQSTVPLFDGVPLETDPPLPLKGIGMFHKGIKEDGVPRWAGFISLRLYPSYSSSQKYFDDVIANHIIGKAGRKRVQIRRKSWHVQW